MDGITQFDLRRSIQAHLAPDSLTPHTGMQRLRSGVGGTAAAQHGFFNEARGGIFSRHTLQSAEILRQPRPIFFGLAATGTFTPHFNRAETRACPPDIEFNNVLTVCQYMLVRAACVLLKDQLTIRIKIQVKPTQAGEVERMAVQAALTVNHVSREGNSVLGLRHWHTALIRETGHNLT